MHHSQVLAIRGHSCRLNEKRRSDRLQRRTAEAKSEKKTVSGQNLARCYASHCSGHRGIGAPLSRQVQRLRRAAARVRGVERLSATE
jgi:hypothetical protein